MERQKSGISREEHSAFEWTLLQALALGTLVAAEDAARQAADGHGAVRQADSDREVQDTQDAGQYVNEDHVSMQPEPVYFHYPWNFVSSQLKTAKGDEIFY